MRTDQTSVCLRCRLRFSARLDFCPKCVGEPFRDAAQAIDLLSEGRLGPPPVIESLTENRSVGGLGGALGELARGALAQLFGSRVPVRLASDPGLEADQADPAARVLVGVVEALPDVELRAPLSGSACVAFRVRGTVGDDQVDDADATPFVLVNDEDGERTVIRPPAAVGLAVEARGEPDDAARARLAPFLAARALGFGERPARLGEALLLPGDHVSCSGLPGGESVSDGYRSVTIRPTLGDARGAPLVIRRVR